MRSIVNTMAILSGVIILSACQTPGSPSPAVLENSNEDNLAALRKGLAKAMGRANVALGPDDPTRNSSITVLPPPPGPSEDRSLAMPTYFDLMLVNNECVLAARESGDHFPLPGVACRKL